ncbi:MAG TPA: hypothetical protein VGN14_13230, partial [Candidatus Elarobacter sp.]
VPVPNGHAVADLTSFAIDPTFWLNLAFGALAVWLWRLDLAHPMEHHCHGEPEHSGSVPTP